jgi:hypothetical protein
VQHDWHIGGYEQGWLEGRAVRIAIYTIAALAAGGTMYLIAGRRFRPLLGRRPYIAIAVASGALFVASESYAVASAFKNPADASMLITSLQPVFIFVTVAIIMIVSLAPRLLISSALPRSRTVLLAASAIAVIVLCAAVCRSLEPGDLSHRQVTVPAYYPMTAAAQATTVATWLAFPLVGVLVFVCAGGLSRRAPRALSYAAIVSALSIWCIGPNLSFLSIPVAALLALITIPFIALRPHRDVADLAAQDASSIPTQAQMFADAEIRADVAQAARTQRRLRDDFVGGTITREEYDAKNTGLQHFINENGSSETIDANRLRGSMFAAFPLAEPFRAATRASIIGVAFGLIWLALGFDQLRSVVSGTQIPAVALAGYALGGLLANAVAAFVFVLFLPFFRSSMATTKGLLLGAAVLAAMLPIELIAENPKTAVLESAMMLLFFPVVGAVFDISVLVHYASRMSFSRLLSFAGFGSFATIGTVLATAVVTAVTGQLKDVTGQLINGAMPTSAHVQQASKPGSGGP